MSKWVLGASALMLAAGCDGTAGGLAGDELEVLSTDEAALNVSVERACGADATTSPGDPLPGLERALSRRFDAGLHEFASDEGVADGLGPVFNDTGCFRCHSAGGIGGASSTLETRFGARLADGGFDPLAGEGGSLRQRQGITNAALGCTQTPEVVPGDANVVALRRTTALFGLGLLEAVPEALLRSLADPHDADGDGISGRVSLVVDVSTGKLAVGRFGWKAQVPSVLAFAGDAYLNEMGITNTLFPVENLPQGQPIACDDGRPSPELDDVDADGDGVSDGVEAFADFMRLLAPPPPGPTRRSADVQSGGRSFVRVGCAKCHLPELHTGRSDVGPLAQRRFFPFTDLLLHDMGSLGDGIVQGDASGSEMRTAPLWGLRLNPGPFLHDGRAKTVLEAIERHDGEAATARDAAARLSPGQRDELLAFLNAI